MRPTLPPAANHKSHSRYSRHRVWTTFLVTADGLRERQQSAECVRCVHAPAGRSRAQLSITALSSVLPSMPCSLCVAFTVNVKCFTHQQQGREEPTRSAWDLHPLWYSHSVHTIIRLRLELHRLSGLCNLHGNNNITMFSLFYCAAL